MFSCSHKDWEIASWIWPFWRQKKEIHKLFLNLFCFLEALHHLNHWWWWWGCCSGSYRVLSSSAPVALDSPSPGYKVEDKAMKSSQTRNSFYLQSCLNKAIPGLWVPSLWQLLAPPDHSLFQGEKENTQEGYRKLFQSQPVSPSEVEPVCYGSSPLRSCEVYLCVGFLPSLKSCDLIELFL